jgi:putative acetyltransferase
MDASRFGPPRGASLIALIEGEPAGCGAVRFLEPGVAELKRMYVAERFRRRGIGAAILRALEREALALGYSRVRFETGTLQPEAIAFYEDAGYRRIECYEQWFGYALSVCFEKRVAP